jgi:hypothetical protein
LGVRAVLVRSGIVGIDTFHRRYTKGRANRNR